jgi:predicted Fe-Mo cluster-binding NifX family protein
MDLIKSEEKSIQLATSVGGLATIGEKQLAKISERMIEIDRANHTAGRSNTQTTNQLMTLTMLTDSPYRRLRQCLAEIEKKRSALDENYYRMKKGQVKINQWREKGDELSLIKAEEKEHGMQRSKDYIDGAFKEIAVFQEAYEEIRVSHNIPKNWDEKDAEEDEIRHHIRQAFRQAHRDVVNTGRIGLGNMEYMEQYGIHIQTAQKIITDYMNEEEKMISEGNFPTVNRLYGFLDKMVETFHDSHKDVLNRIGIKTLIKEEFLYTENKENGDIGI